MREQFLIKLRAKAEALARELSNTPAFVKRTWTAVQVINGDRFDLIADGLDDITFYIEGSRTYGRFSLGAVLPEPLWKYEPKKKDRPAISIAADREPASAARYVMSALIIPGLAYLEETEQNRDATERTQRARAASAAQLIEASGGLIQVRSEQSHPNRWRNTVPVVDTVFDGNELGIEGQVDIERAHLNFSNLLIDEAAILLRVLSAVRASRVQAGEGEEEAASDGDWLALVA